MQIRKYISTITIIFCSLLLFGCATTYHHGDGIVISEKKLKDRDYKPHEITKTAATVGGGIGGTIGAAFGGVSGFGIGQLANISGAMVLVPTLAGGTIGALIFGGVGAITVGGLGYAIDLSRSDFGVYQFVVKPKNGSKPLTIIQYSRAIPISTPVQILEKNKRLFIE